MRAHQPRQETQENYERDRPESCAIPMRYKLATHYTNRLVSKRQLQRRKRRSLLLTKTALHYTLTDTCAARFWSRVNQDNQGYGLNSGHVDCSARERERTKYRQRTPIEPSSRPRRQ